MTNIKLSKTQMSKLTQSVGFIGNMIDRLDKEALVKFDAPLTKVFFTTISN